ncbi:MAG: GNAT family N-acetyltransferase [Pseudomonadota bacterium]
MIRLERLTGAALGAVLEQVANLRITVFREWPYLYDGDEAYERAYLEAYRESEHALLVGAFEGGDLIGASTGTPMEDHAKEFGNALAGGGVALKNIFYGAESVLLPEYRGQGIGHRFFDLREAFAKELGFTHVAFCSVVRDDAHPLKPEGHRPLSNFWVKRGYAPVAGAVASFCWKDVDQPAETDHDLQFWMRKLS